MQAQAFWLARPGLGEVRTAALPDPEPGQALVRALYSGVSRGTETTVFRGEVPAATAGAMRAPFQDGDFPAPVKYGYLSVGVVEQGSPELLGRTVFCLYPHQTHYVVPESAVVPVPDEVSPMRAVLAGTVETAVNALWDAGPLVGDRVAVVGAGMVGCCLARLLAGIPGIQVDLIDVDESRAEIAGALGVGFASPGKAVGHRDLVFHTSSTGAGLQTSLDLLRDEGTVWDLSFYGTRLVEVALGGAFHTGRLAVRSSQVGRVAPARRGDRSTVDRLALALELLGDPVFDALLSGPVDFVDLPVVMAELAAGRRSALCQVIDYQGV